MSRTRRGSRRGSAVTARLVRTLPAAQSSSLHSHQTWGLVVTAAATFVTLAVSLGASNTSTPDVMGSSAARVGHQSLFASPKNHGGISIVQRSRGRALQEDTAVVSTPIVQYGTELQLFMCSPSQIEAGDDAYLVDETRVASALSKVDGLRQVRVD